MKKKYKLQFIKKAKIVTHVLLMLFVAVNVQSKNSLVYAFSVSDPPPSNPDLATSVEECLDFTASDWRGRFASTSATNIRGTNNYLTSGKFFGKNSFRQEFVPSGRGSPRVTAFANVTPAKTYSIKQSLYLEPDWQSARGGKLGFGLGGGSVPTGGEARDDGFSARLAWSGENLVIHAYSANRTTGIYGQPFDFDGFSLTRGTWIDLAMEVTMNSAPGVADGTLRASANGVEVVNETGIEWWGSGTPQIDTVLFSSFYGGADPTWAPTENTYAAFADACYTADEYIDEVDNDVCEAVEEEFSDLQNDFYPNVFWEQHILPALISFSTQMSALAMQQTMIIGTFFDAKHQLESQRIIQTVQARAHKDYHTSHGMCQIASGIKSLAASERKGELTAHVVSVKSKNRMLGNADTSGAVGPAGDYAHRIAQYSKYFCDPADYKGQLSVLCNDTETDDVETKYRRNKDINFQHTVLQPWTLDVDFTDEKLTNDEEEVLALASNLYGDQVFQNISDPRTLQFASTQSAYMDARAHLAKLSVAENSFNSLIAMKSAGTLGSRQFLEAILAEMGVKTDNDAPSDTLRMLGMDSNNMAVGPSYYAQMEVLSKKVYQNPDFYTNLYDTPANVDRKKVAMQAIGLMQKFDLFDSHLRYESNLSVLLELAVAQEQRKYTEEFNSQTE